MIRFVVKSISCLLVAAFLITAMSPVAEAGSLFTTRRTFGVLFLGGSVFMAKKSLDFRRNANDIYEAYKVADNGEEAEQFFDRSSDRDSKSQMSAGISFILLVSGLRLLFFSGLDKNVPKMDRKIDIDVTGEYNRGTVGLALRRRF